MSQDVMCAGDHSGWRMWAPGTQVATVGDVLRPGPECSGQEWLWPELGPQKITSLSGKEAASHHMNQPGPPCPWMELTCVTGEWYPWITVHSQPGARKGLCQLSLFPSMCCSDSAGDLAFKSEQHEWPRQPLRVQGQCRYSCCILLWGMGIHIGRQLVGLTARMGAVLTASLPRLFVREGEVPGWTQPSVSSPW